MSITSGTGEFATRAIHAGYDPADYGHAAVPPIYASAAFDLENAQRGDALAGGLIDGFEYSRVANPTVDVLEKRLAALEGGIGAVAVGSGMAAVSYALMCVGEGGGRIIAPSNLYGASVDALGDFLPQFGIHTDFVKHINDLAEVESKIGPDTRAIFAETVANPSTEILDIEPLSQLAHEHGIALIVDNTVPTPYLLRPIEFGADIVVHSTTKGITGHGNAIGGAVIDGGHLDWANGRFPQFTTRQPVQCVSFLDWFGNIASARQPAGCLRATDRRAFESCSACDEGQLFRIGIYAAIRACRQVFPSRCRSDPVVPGGWQRR